MAQRKTKGDSEVRPPHDEKSVRCPICESLDVVPWRTSSAESQLGPEDFAITDSRYGTTLALLRCRSCTFIFVDPHQGIDLESLYSELEDPGYDETSEQRRLQMRKLLNQVGGRGAQGRLLDIGAATGLLVEEARQLGYDAVGVEPSWRLVQRASSRGIPVIQGIWPHPDFMSQRFDVITMVDVIEHVSNPVQFLRAAAHALNENGILVVVTPDVSSFAARLLGRRWWHFRIAHVGYFTPTTMRLAARGAGLRVSQMSWASWYFPVWYLADRLTEFLPVGPINRYFRNVPVVRKVYSATIPVNLFDSRKFVFEADIR